MYVVRQRTVAGGRKQALWKMAEFILTSPKVASANLSGLSLEVTIIVLEKNDHNIDPQEGKINNHFRINKLFILKTWFWNQIFIERKVIL